MRAPKITSPPIKTFSDPYTPMTAKGMRQAAERTLNRKEDGAVFLAINYSFENKDTSF
jgi:hypothetical protein